MNDLASALARTDEPKALNAVTMLQSPAALQQVQEALPKGMDGATFIRHAVTLVKQNPQLMACDPVSVAQGIVRGAALGLEPDPALGQMYLVPRRTKLRQPGGPDVWADVATFQVGYRGLYELAMRTGRIAKIEVNAVHERDDFDASYGTGGGLRHRPNWFGDRGPVIGWYARAVIKDGTETFEVLARPDAEKHRDRFAPKDKSGQVYGPWADHFDAMAEKTVFIKLAKWLPKQVEIQRALEDDGRAFLHPLGGEIHPGDVIEPAVVAEAPQLAAVATENTTTNREAGGDDGTALAGDAVNSSDGASSHDAGPSVPEPPAVGDADGLPLADENGDPVGGTAPSWSRRNAKAQAMGVNAWKDDDAQGRTKKRKALVGIVSKGRTDTSKELADDEWDDLFGHLEDFTAGHTHLWQRSNGGYEIRRGA